MPRQLAIYVGFDPKESVAYHVLCHSILSRASGPVSITPVVRTAVPGFTRPRGPLDSTEFSISRFMVPALCDFKGRAVFMDCDFLCLANIHELLFEVVRQSDKSVLVCQHDYSPRDEIKFFDQAQTRYPRKNWSSLMVFNNERCRALTPSYVNTAHGLELHRFAWLKDDQIGSLPLSWNHLVGEYPPDPEAKMLHYTRGGPWCGKSYADGPEAELWFAERERMLGRVA